MLVLPQGMHNCLFPEVTILLLCLEAVTQVAFCCCCYLPRLHCRCLRAAQSASTPSMTPAPSMALAPSWSQVAELTPGYGSTASMGTTTTLSTSSQGAAGVAPPPGLSTSRGGPASPRFPCAPAAAGHSSILTFVRKRCHPGCPTQGYPGKEGTGTASYMANDLASWESVSHTLQTAGAGPCQGQWTLNQICPSHQTHSPRGPRHSGVG